MCSIGLVLKCAIVHTLSLSDQVIKFSQAVINFWDEMHETVFLYLLSWSFPPSI